MNGTTLEPSELLRSLLDSLPSGRATRDSGNERASPGLLALGDEIEQLTVTDLSVAMTAAGLLVELADLIGSPRERARARRAQAQGFAYAGEFRDALAVCDEAASIADAAGETVESARARLASLHALAAMARFDEAIAIGNAASRLLTEAGEPELAARADLNLGAVYAMMDDPATALELFDRARPALASTTTMIAQLETNRGNALVALDRYQQAEAAFASAVTAFEEGQQPIAAAIVEGNLGYLAARRGLLQPAMRHYERARRLLDRSDAGGHRLRMIAEQAEVLATLGLPVDAIEAFEQVIPSLDAAGLAIEAGRARLNYGRALIGLERFADASTALAAAGQALTRTGHSTEHAKTLVLEAGLALQAGDLDGAAELIAAALELLDERPVDLAQAMLTAARIDLAGGALTGASGRIAQAMAIADRHALSPVLADAHVLRGQLRRRRGEPAVADFRAAVEETEALRGTLQIELFRSAFHADRLAPYEELLREALSLPGNDGVADAFHASELVKSRSLLDIVGSERGVAPGPVDSESAAFQLRSAEIQAELNWRYSRIAEIGAPNAGNGDRIRELERESERLLARAGATADPTSPAAPVIDLATALAALPAGTTALSYCVTGDDVSAIVLKYGAATMHAGFASLTNVLAAIRRFRLQIARVQAHSGDSDRAAKLLADVQRELQQLWRLLIEPVQNELNQSEQLLIVPHGALHTIPFGALWDGGAHLVEQFDLVHTPSLSLHNAIGRTPSPNVAGNALVVGVADALTPSIPLEVQRVASELHADTLTDEQATAEAVTAKVDRAGIVHFACHGRFAREHPKASGLKLADRWLTLAEISALRFPGAHVTLSACDTGRASIRAGDELVGLTRAFYAAGARSLIVSLWPVVDESAVDLMGDCYRHHASGMTWPAALRAAQRRALESTPHPAHWAPFVFGGVA